ncbi:ATPase [Streptomyces fumigatiscleroticus]|nr:ATPase [Streptomyces fumigatiscleroticus]
MIPSAPLGTDAAGRLGPGAATEAPSWAAAERRFRFELAAHPGSPAQARRLARARLSGWSVCEDTCDTAALVITELVTNAIMHTASRHIVCELLDGADLVRIAVRDEGCAPGGPHPPAPQRAEEEHGRGLLLVDALCHAWGAQEHGPGLLVWAELPRRTGFPADPAQPCGDLDVDPAQPCGDLGLDPAQPRGDLGLDPAQPRGDLGLDPAQPRGDLGWGARPKPGTTDGSRSEDEAEARRRTGGEWV